MIRLAFIIDRDDVIGNTIERSHEEIIQSMPEGVFDQIKKVSMNSHFIVGRNSYELYLASDFSEERKLFVLTKDPELKIVKSGVEVVRDFMKLVEKYMTSQEVVTVFGGGEVLSLFLPYAKEMRVVMLDQSLQGDLVFSDWKKDKFDLVKSEQWQSGTTYYYVKA